MKPPLLLIFAAFLNYISTLSFFPTVAVCALPMKSRLLWPVTIVLFPLTIPFLGVWSVTQVISSFCAFNYHQKAGTRASVQADGLHINSKPVLQVISWHDINMIRRVYERAFGDYKTRFSDKVAYQVTLNSGYNLYIDFIDEAVLSARVKVQGIAIEGFDSHLLASKFEPIQ